MFSRWSASHVRLWFDVFVCWFFGHRLDQLWLLKVQTRCSSGHNKHVCGRSQSRQQVYGTTHTLRFSFLIWPTHKIPRIIKYCIFHLNKTSQNPEFTRRNIFILQTDRKMCKKKRRSHMHARGRVASNRENPPLFVVWVNRFPFLGTGESLSAWICVPTRRIRLLVFLTAWKSQFFALERGLRAA